MLLRRVLTVSLVFSASPLAAQPTFVNASDGDTLVVRDGGAKTVLRLAEIDAPERTQPYSQVSRRSLIALCKEARPIEVRPGQPRPLRPHGCPRPLWRSACQLEASTGRAGMVFSQVPDAARWVLAFGTRSTRREARPVARRETDCAVGFSFSSSHAGCALKGINT